MLELHAQNEKAIGQRTLSRQYLPILECWLFLLFLKDEMDHDFDLKL